MCVSLLITGDRAEAIDMYSKGITELEKAVAMSVHTTGEERGRERRERESIISLSRGGGKEEGGGHEEGDAEEH